MHAEQICLAMEAPANAASRLSTERDTELHLLRGDITETECDAIVNAEDEMMLGSGGVDVAAGPQLRQACSKVKLVCPSVRCPTGEARLTEGFDLPAKYVLHAAGPHYWSYKDPQEAAEVLHNCHIACFELAKNKGLKSLAIPGSYGFSVPLASMIAIKASQEAASECSDLKVVLLVLHDQLAWDYYRQAAAELQGPLISGPQDEQLPPARPQKGWSDDRSAKTNKNDTKTDQTESETDQAETKTNQSEAKTDQNDAKTDQIDAKPDQTQALSQGIHSAAARGSPPCESNMGDKYGSRVSGEVSSGIRYETIAVDASQLPAGTIEALPAGISETLVDGSTETLPSGIPETMGDGGAGSWRCRQQQLKVTLPCRRQACQFSGGTACLGCCLGDCCSDKGHRLCFGTSGNNAVLHKCCCCKEGRGLSPASSSDG